MRRLLWLLFGRRRDRLAVFRAWDRPARRWRYWDPIAVRRGLDEHGGPGWADLVDHAYRLATADPPGLTPELAAARVKTRERAAADLAGLVAKAFGVVPVQAERDGWTEAERVDLMAAFLVWCDEVTRATRPL